MPPYYRRDRELDLDIERAYLRTAILSNRTSSLLTYPGNYYPYLPSYSYYGLLPPPYLYYGALPPYPYFY